MERYMLSCQTVERGEKKKKKQKPWRNVKFLKQPCYYVDELC